MVHRLQRSHHFGRLWNCWCKSPSNLVCRRKTKKRETERERRCISSWLSALLVWIRDSLSKCTKNPQHTPHASSRPGKTSFCTTIDPNRNSLHNPTHPSQHLAPCDRSARSQSKQREVDRGRMHTRCRKGKVLCGWLDKKRNKKVMHWRGLEPRSSRIELNLHLRGVWDWQRLMIPLHYQCFHASQPLYCIYKRIN